MEIILMAVCARQNTQDMITSPAAIPVMQQLLFQVSSVLQLLVGLCQPHLQPEYLALLLIVFL